LVPSENPAARRVFAFHVEGLRQVLSTKYLLI
jgi:hypothetical protein